MKNYFHPRMRAMPGIGYVALALVTWTGSVLGQVSGDGKGYSHGPRRGVLVAGSSGSWVRFYLAWYRTARLDGSGEPGARLDGGALPF